MLYGLMCGRGSVFAIISVYVVRSAFGGYINCLDRLYQAKTGEHVYVPVPEDVATTLRSVKHKNPAYFFWSGHSKVPAAVSVWRKRLADVFTKAKISNGHSHRLRDTFAVSLLEAGVSLDSVSILLGHKSIKITERHYSPWVKTRQDALDREILKVISNGPQEQFGNK
jgi:integrase/recombinase XerD